MDRVTGTVFLTFNEDAFRSYVMSSDDNGATWSEAVEITDSIMPSHWTHYVMGPGKGIQLKSGRLAIPAGHLDSHRLDSIFSHSHVFYSDDHGATWQVGGALPGGFKRVRAGRNHRWYALYGYQGVQPTVAKTPLCVEQGRRGDLVRPRRVG